DLEQCERRDRVGQVVADYFAREPAEQIADQTLLAPDEPYGRRVDRGIAQQVQREFLVRDEAWLSGERPDDVGEGLDSFFKGVPGDLGGLQRGDQLLHPRLERREQQALSRAEVMLDDTPRHAGTLRDAVRARAVEAFLEDALDRCVAEACPRLRGG